MRERADQPFGDVHATSGQTLQPFSIAGQQAATNLLVKAHRALDDGDNNRARRFVDRAVSLPYDEHECAAPVALATHMDLFCLVTDALERSETDDSRWLDAAEEVLDNVDETGRCDMRDVLVAIDHDYSISAEEHRRIRAAVTPIPDRAELRDRHLTPTELGNQVMSILHACGRYRAALHTQAGGPER
jgi:hypothetical protein